MQIAEFRIVKQDLKKHQHDEKDPLKDVTELNKLARIKDKEIYRKDLITLYIPEQSSEAEDDQLTQVCARKYFFYGVHFVRI